jgi:hypothetical protein
MTRIDSNKLSVGESSNISKAFLNDSRRTDDGRGLDAFVAFCINCADCI